MSGGKIGGFGVLMLNMQIGIVALLWRYPPLPPRSLFSLNSCERIVGVGWDRLTAGAICPVDVIISVKGIVERVCGTTYFSDGRASEAVLGETHLSTDTCAHPYHTTTAGSKGQGFRGMAYCNAIHRIGRIHVLRS